VDNNKNTKFKLVDEFVRLGGNYSKDVKSLEKTINKHLKDIKGDDIQLLDILRILKVYQKQIKEPNAFSESCEIVSPIIERLLNTNINKWIIEDAKISQIAIYMD